MGTLRNLYDWLWPALPAATPAGAADNPAPVAALALHVASAAAAVERPVPPVFAGKPYLTGTCNICGEPARFFRDAPELDRESLTCEHCRSTSRYRSIARGLLRAIRQRTSLASDSLATLPAHANVPVMRIYDTQPAFHLEGCAYPIPDILQRCSWIEVTQSSFDPGAPRGAVLRPGVVNEDLQQLTFASNSFDAVVTSDVMEHVRLDALAHREIARVLKTGGAYVFTVPHFRHARDTFVRVRVVDPADPATDEFLAEPEYHGDANAPGSRGALSYRAYGTDLDDALDELGFDVTYERIVDEAHCIRNAELFYCIKR